jgi:SpoVK/Ycf46/Vps4 family AAA+-type ATPase
MGKSWSVKFRPPGTGKTLMARALASSCSTSTQKVTFFMRKGADILSKWVGESERQLRALFDQAKAFQPSIIFFDGRLGFINTLLEIDGLAPVRSSKQDQIHSSIVSTLLSLMDGLDSRGNVVWFNETKPPDRFALVRRIDWTPLIQPSVGPVDSIENSTFRCQKSMRVRE